MHCQAPDQPLFRNHFYEMDIPFRGIDVAAFQRTRTHLPRLGFHSPYFLRRTRLPHHIRNLHKLFPHPDRPESPSSHPCKHVQLCPAHHSHPDQHLHRYGYAQLAEDIIGDSRFCRRDNSQPEQDKGGIAEMTDFSPNFHNFVQIEKYETNPYSLRIHHFHNSMRGTKPSYQLDLRGTAY